MVHNIYLISDQMIETGTLPQSNNQNRSPISDQNGPKTMALGVAHASKT